MDRKTNVRVVGFPKEKYDKETLDKLKDKELSEMALWDGDTAIFEDLRDFQDTVLNAPFTEQLVSNYWYFLTD